MRWNTSPALQIRTNFWTANPLIWKDYALGGVALDARIPFGSAFISVLLSSVSAQPSSSPISTLQNEVTKWSVLTYTQQYIDDQNENVVYQGTIFLQLSKVSLNGCDLELGVRVQDKFTGTITKAGLLKVKTKYIGQTSETYSYRYLLKLGDFQRVHVTVLDSRPAQLKSKTGYNCDEEPSCRISWLDLKLPRALIKETREKNELVDFDQKVSEITIPMSSRQAAQVAATTFQELVAGCQSKDRP